MCFVFYYIWLLMILPDPVIFPHPARIPSTNDRKNEPFFARTEIKNGQVTTATAA